MVGLLLRERLRVARDYNRSEQVLRYYNNFIRTLELRLCPQVAVLLIPGCKYTSQYGFKPTDISYSAAYFCLSVAMVPPAF